MREVKLTSSSEEVLEAVKNAADTILNFAREWIKRVVLPAAENLIDKVKTICNRQQFKTYYSLKIKKLKYKKRVRNRQALYMKRKRIYGKY